MTTRLNAYADKTNNCLFPSDGDKPADEANAQKTLSVILANEGSVRRVRVSHDVAGVMQAGFGPSRLLKLTFSESGTNQRGPANDSRVFCIDQSNYTSTGERAPISLDITNVFAERSEASQAEIDRAKKVVHVVYPGMPVIDAGEFIDTVSCYNDANSNNRSAIVQRLLAVCEASLCGRASAGPFVAVPGGAAYPNNTYLLWPSNIPSGAPPVLPVAVQYTTLMDKIRGMPEKVVTFCPGSALTTRLTTGAMYALFRACKPHCGFANQYSNNAPGLAGKYEGQIYLYFYGNATKRAPAAGPVVPPLAAGGPLNWLNVSAAISAVCDVDGAGSYYEAIINSALLVRFSGPECLHLEVRAEDRFRGTPASNDTLNRLHLLYELLHDLAQAGWGVNFIAIVNAVFAIGAVAGNLVGHPGVPTLGVAAINAAIPGAAAGLPEGFVRMCQSAASFNALTSQMLTSELQAVGPIVQGFNFAAYLTVAVPPAAAPPVVPAAGAAFAGFDYASAYSLMACGVQGSGSQALDSGLTGLFAHLGNKTSVYDRQKATIPRGSPETMMMGIYMPSLLVRCWTDYYVSTLQQCQSTVSQATGFVDLNPPNLDVTDHYGIAVPDITFLRGADALQHVSLCVKQRFHYGGALFNSVGANCNTEECSRLNTWVMPVAFEPNSRRVICGRDWDMPGVMALSPQFLSAARSGDTVLWRAKGLENMRYRDIVGIMVELARYGQARISLAFRIMVAASAINDEPVIALQAVPDVVCGARASDQAPYLPTKVLPGSLFCSLIHVGQLQLVGWQRTMPTLFGGVGLLGRLTGGPDNANAFPTYGAAAAALPVSTSFKAINDTRVFIDRVQPVPVAAPAILGAPTNREVLDWQTTFLNETLQSRPGAWSSECAPFLTPFASKPVWSKLCGVDEVEAKTAVEKMLNSEDLGAPPF
uniref:Uncharacterized protein n=2 Tax=viral metagenome TaxID=1070528 RepID=A0A2V0RBU7_9ZZZZ